MAAASGLPTMMGAGCSLIVSPLRVTPRTIDQHPFHCVGIEQVLVTSVNVWKSIGFGFRP
jgi:hypothetical protein